MSPRICRNCILPDTIPGVTFNEEGICDLCEEEITRQRKAKHPRLRTEEDFVRSLKKSRGSYDVLCLYSGGKDSSYMLYHLAKKMRLKVLALTLDNWFISPQTLLNIKTTLQRLECVDHLFVKPAWSQVQKTFRSGFELKEGTSLGEKAFLLGHACFSCFGLISLYAVKTAVEKSIPNIVVGATPGQLAQKDIHNLREKYRTADEAFQSIAVPLMGKLSQEDPELRNAFHLSFIQKLRITRLHLAPFYEFIRYNEEEVYRTVEGELGWKRPKDTDSCSTNCQINALGIHVHKQKYGISPYTIPLAHDVRIGLLKREDALRQVNGQLNMGIVKKIAQQIGVSHMVESENIADPLPERTEILQHTSTS